MTEEELKRFQILFNASIASINSTSLGRPSKPYDYNSGKETCECGAKATGVQNFRPGHSNWCPVRVP